MELTARQVTERLGVSRDWVSRMCRSGTLAGARKIGPIWVIPEEALAGVTVPGPGRPRKTEQGKPQGKGRES
ncbi:MAG: helix-turn-helix domain-containing protein [Armatimonadetes bacterium]|nr:helix-turn-helix domain-containing protein [Armatimonadota bacterium]